MESATTSRWRPVLLGVVAFLWMGLIVGRLVQLQVFRYSDFLARAQRQQQRTIEVTPRRGVIYDRNYRELAMSVEVESAFAVPSEIADPELVASLLAPIVHVEPVEILDRLHSSRSFCWFKRKLDADEAARIRALNLKGIYFLKENKRFYPKRELAAHVLGYVGIDENGMAGLEYALDSEIRGRPGKLLILADARRRWFRRQERPADSGSNVVLTIDEKIQYIAERELAAAIEETHAAAGTVLVQDPNTGEVLALANAPTFNPNRYAESTPEARIDRATSSAYEPGSTFKIFTVSAALEEGLARPEETIDCQMGAIVLAGHRIRDHKPFGILNVAQILQYSSDVGAIKIGLRLGERKFYDYIRAFGFGSATRIELPGENRGLVRAVENWSKISIGSISMGQEIGVTPLQLTTAVSAIANGGVLYEPRVVREVFRPGSQPGERRPANTRRAISARTAATLRRIMEGVVITGTGVRAKLNGYTAAGKTGTAQKIDESGAYSRSKFIASFVGFAPVNNPTLTISVILDSPVGHYHGGDVAAPVFKRVAEQVLAYLDVPHDMPITPRQMLAQARLPVGQAAPPEISDFTPEQSETAQAQAELPVFPAAQEKVESAAATVLLTPSSGVEVPDLKGKSVRAVTEECLSRSLDVTLIGTGVAAAQSPPPGSHVPAGSRITVRFSRSLPARAGGAAAERTRTM